MSNRPLAFSAERLLHTLQSFPVVSAYIVGFSSGADSTALLHALNSIRGRLDVPISAVHINHGLHDDAGVWQLQAENFCQQNNITLVCLNVDPQNNLGKGLEAEARHLRYEAISALLEPGACLLTAHHADDQGETLLLNLMRGSGVDGLSAMPECRPLGCGFLQRPLLQYQKSVLEDYLRKNNIEWTEDPSNQYINHDRNFVRHQIVPLLENRWPEVSKRLLLTRRAMSEARYLLERLADENLHKNLLHPFVFEITTQLLPDPELLKLVIRRWVKQAGAPSIPAYRLETLYEQVQHAGTENNVTICWDGWTLRLYKQQLWLFEDSDLVPCPRINWPAGTQQIELGKDVGQLVFKPTDQSDIGSGKPPAAPGDFSVGNRTCMNESVINQGAHHKTLKNLFQSANIPPWLRDCIPLCKHNGELVLMGDWCCSDSFAAWLSDNNLGLCWQPRHPLLQFILSQHHLDPEDG